MSGPDLPDLLEALGELFVVPGGFDRARFEALGRASWAGLGITPALHTLLIADARELDVAYAGLFLQGRTRPTLHLEASAQFAGTLADPGLLARLERIAEVAGVGTVPGIQPDHLGVMLALLALLFRQRAAAAGGCDERLERASAALLQDFLLPLAARVCGALAEAGTPPFYQAAGRLLDRALALSLQVAA